jgi:hypothetical protein
VLGATATLTTGRKDLELGGPNGGVLRIKHSLIRRLRIER